MTAPPPARLFPGTAFGTSVWAHVPHERFMCMRPCRRVAHWLACQGLAVSPGTLADGTGRMLPLFEPIWDAILARRNEAGLRHADGTGWRIQGAEGDPEVPTRVALDVRQPRRGPLPRRPLAQRRRRREAVLRRRRTGLPSLRPLQRVQEAGAAVARHDHPVLLLGARPARLPEMRGGTAAADGVEGRMDRPDRGHLPAERCPARLPQSGQRIPGEGVRGGAGRAGGRGRRAVRGSGATAGGASGNGAGAQAAAFAGQAPGTARG